jgi:hydrogenase maturation protein HypF
LRRKTDDGIAPQVAPGNPYLGVMLPYAPLHMLLLEGFGGSLVATSANIAEETICIDEYEALTRLSKVADYFLVHDRVIVRAVDDAVARVILGQEQLIRRARGYAPLPVIVDQGLAPVLAVGGQLKDTVALARGSQVFISQHIGDLEALQAHAAFTRIVDDLKGLYEITPEKVVCDIHPDYHSTRIAQQMGLPVIQVQHHYAHVLSCMADNGIAGPVLGVAWDGSGHGLDGTVWGGEFLSVGEGAFKRSAYFDPIYLPGGEAAVREPRRSLIGALYAAWDERAFEERYKVYFTDFMAQEYSLTRQMLCKKLNSPMTSSVGRLFDAVAALTGLCRLNGFEGQAAMALEFALPEQAVPEAYPFDLIDGTAGSMVIRHAAMWDEIVRDLEKKVPVSIISARFHNMLVNVIIAVARKTGMERVVLTGGCFQNRYLTEHAVKRLREEGFKPYWHQRVPPNDGGLALGQIMATVYQGL